MESEMKKLSISNDIVPVGEFKSSISKWLRSIKNSGHPLIITQNGRPAGVLLSPSEYDGLIYKKQLLESVERGLADVEAGRVYSSMEAKKELARLRAERNAG